MITDYNQFEPVVEYPNRINYFTVTEIDLETGGKTTNPLYETEYLAPSSHKLDNQGRFVKLDRNTTVIFQFDKEGFRTKQREYNKSVQEGEERFKKYLFDNYCNLSEDRHKIIFEKAWSDGHSNGFGEVEYHYSELVDFAENLLSAGGEQ